MAQRFLNFLLRLALLLFAAVTFAAGPAQAERRLALVIGNDAYSEVAPLQKAVPDARAMAGALEGLGFDIHLATDVGRRAFNLAIADFTAALEPGDTAVLFFAGHGVEIEGENYLLPVDIVAPSDVRPGLIVSESISLSSLLERVRRTGARATLAFVDACRDNPFAETAGRSIGGSRGLARVAAPEGTFVVFSAGAGQQALDRLHDGDDNPNSVFTRNLLPRLSERGLELRDLVSEVRIEVRDLARTRDHAQFPAYYDELLGQFYFLPPGAGSAEPAPVEQPAAAQVDDTIRRDFELAQSIGSAAALRAFLDRHGQREEDFTVLLARQLLDNLEGDDAAPPQEPEVALVEPNDQDAARDRMRATQAELNRLGCGAGGADGIAGPRTRSAFSAFLRASGAELGAGDLGSDKALGVLKAAKAPVCTSIARGGDGSRVADAGPSLAGNWSYRANCPLFIVATGTASFRRLGPNSYAFSWRDTSGGAGTGATTMVDRSFTTNAQMTGGPRVTETGTLSADGRSYTASNSLGCKVTARKS